MSRFLEISNDTLFWYYLASNVAYLFMLMIALRTTARHHHLLQSYRLGWVKETSLTPPITIIVPAHNEEKSIRVSVWKLLELDYPELEIVVVNDGSQDRTTHSGARDEFASFGNWRLSGIEQKRDNHCEISCPRTPSFTN